jgi:GMP synthase (glutamine-hydrolysing)
MRTLYIVKTGSTLPSIAQQYGDFEHWIAQGMRPEHLPLAKRATLHVIDAATNCHGPLAYPAPAMCAGVVISGSHDMVTDNAPWMQDLAQWLQQVCHAGVPVLGICFGHQLLAHTLGGQVGVHPSGLELGTVPVAIQADVSHDPIWKDMPSCFDAHVVHYQSVRRLPQEACVLAGNSHEPHQAFRWRNNVWGVQFHPEFSQAAMQGYIDHVVQDLRQHGAAALPTPSLRCAPTEEAAQLLAHFTRHALHWSQAQKPWPAAA